MALNPGRSAYDLRLFDPEKPNLLFSSDIPSKIAASVAEMHLFAGGTTSRLVDLALNISSFDLVLELNAVVTRDPSVGPSQLVRRNQVFVAKTGALVAPLASAEAEPLPRAQECLPSAPEYWTAVLAKINDVFVVSTSLVVETLTVDLADPTQVEIEFEPGSARLVSQAGVLGTIKTYIQRKLVAELRNNSNLPADITNSLTILQELPVAEHAPMRRFQALRSASAIFDTSLDEFAHKLLVFDDDFDVSGDDVRVLHSDDSGKCTAEEDDDSFDVRALFLQEPICLEGEVDGDTRNPQGRTPFTNTDHSTTVRDRAGTGMDLNNTNGCISAALAKDISVENILIAETNGSAIAAESYGPCYRNDRRQASDTTLIENGDLTGKSLPTEALLIRKHLRDEVANNSPPDNLFLAECPGFTESASSPKTEPTPHRLSLDNDPFTENTTDNLTDDNPFTENTTDNLTDVQSLPISHLGSLQTENTDSIIIQSLPLGSPSRVETSTQTNSPSSNVAEPHFERPPPLQPSYTGEFTPIPSGSPVRLPLRVNQETLPRGGGKSSIAMITTEDSFGLEYAFRDKSSQVPSFIKQNKKFKFIKVGKVQKFVHMFEEKVEEPSSSVASRNPSRNPTRPTSPFNDRRH